MNWNRLGKGYFKHLKYLAKYLVNIYGKNI